MIKAASVLAVVVCHYRNFEKCREMCQLKYEGTRDFYNKRTGNCEKLRICNPGYILDLTDNICTPQRML